MSSTTSLIVKSSLIGAPPKEGPKVVPLNVKFDGTTNVIDLENLQIDGSMRYAQSVFVDNSLNSKSVSLSTSIVGQKITFPPFSQGYAVIANEGKIQISCVTANTNITIPMFFFNIYITPNIWFVTDQTPINYPFTFDNAGNLLVSDTTVQTELGTANSTLSQILTAINLPMTAQAKNTVFAGPSSGSPGFPTFRTFGLSELNDVSSGTFTPLLVTTGSQPTGIAYVTQYGEFEKHGNVINYSLHVLLSNAGAGGSGNIRIDGLPIVARNQLNNYISSLSISNATFPAGRTQCVGIVVPNTTQMGVSCAGSAVGLTGMPWANITNTLEIYATGQYFI